MKYQKEKWLPWLLFLAHFQACSSAFGQYSFQEASCQRDMIGVDVPIFQSEESFGKDCTEFPSICIDLAEESAWDCCLVLNTIILLSQKTTAKDKPSHVHSS